MGPSAAFAASEYVRGWDILSAVIMDSRIGMLILLALLAVKLHKKEFSFCLGSCVKISSCSVMWLHVAFSQDLR